MPRFFFHVRDSSDQVTRDSEGQEFADLEAARREAANTNREMLGEHLLHGGSLNYRRIEIADEKGEVLAMVHANEVLSEDGQLRTFQDDVTKSAPRLGLGDTLSKQPRR